MTPWDELAAYATTVLPTGVNVYSTATSQLVPPAAVIRPDQPWRVPSSFCLDEHRYVVVTVVQAATPDDGTTLLYQMHTALLSDLPEGWGFDNVSGIVLDESTGSPLLAAAVRLTYHHTGEES